MATAHRTCTVDDCDKAHRARGLCATHYNRTLTTRHKMHAVQCDWCGLTAQKYTPTSRYANTYCGTACRDKARLGNEGVSQLPAGHWARWYGATSQWLAPAVKPSTPTFFSGACGECGAIIVEYTHGVPSRWCGNACSRRVMRRIRKAREHNAPGSFHLTDVIQQYIKQGSACAYCHTACDGLPDPEHVIPISRGGDNSMSNIVAACRACNGDKRDLTPTEWAADRARRGLAPVDTTLSGHAFTHLALARPTERKA